MEESEEYRRGKTERRMGKEKGRAVRRGDERSEEKSSGREVEVKR